MPLEFLLEAWELLGVGNSWVEEEEALSVKSMSGKYYH